MLGRLEVRLDGEPVEIASRPARTLLAYLALTLDVHHPRERLAGLFWPESNQSRARKNLRQTLWRLRKAVGDGALEVEAAAVGLPSRPDLWVDVAALDTAAVRDLETAVSAYGGELLPGFYEPWVLLERDRIDAVYDGKMQRLVEGMLTDQRWSEAIKWAESWIASGRIPEAGYRALITAFAATGERPKAEEAYRRCVEALREEIGVEPSDETRELYQRMVAGELSYQRSEGARPRAPRINLPAQPTRFVGREQELAELTSLLSESRLLTLAGPGGIGKTRLAVQLAAELADRFDDGVHFISLAPISTAGELVQAVADGLKFPLSAQEAPEEQLLSYLRPRSLLLVLDNFEHLLEGVAFVSRLLQTAPGLKLLTSSREKLGIQGETVFGVRGMRTPSSPEAGDGQDQEAIEFFLACAQRSRPGFAASAAQHQSVVQICDRVQGMPLAIELAAAWLDTLSTEEVAKELNRSLDILATELRDVPDRHRSIRAVFDHSWSQAGPAEQQAFARLSVFRGGFTRQAAYEVAGASIDLLAGLVGKSFLRHDATLGRFEIHELMRQYAEERLEEDPAECTAAHDRHAAYFAEFARALSSELRGSFDDRPDLKAEREILNLRAAVRHAAGQAQLDELRKFIDGLWLLHELRGWNQAGAGLFGEIAVALGAGERRGEVAEASEVDNQDPEAAMLRNWAIGAQAFYQALLGSPTAAADKARTSAAELRRLEAGSELFIPLVAHNLASVIQLQAEDLLGNAFSNAQEAVELATRLGEDWWEGLFTTWQGSASLLLGRAQDARRYARASLAIFEELGSPYGATWPLQLLARLALGRQDHPEARRLFEDVLHRAQSISFDRGTSLALGALTDVNLQLEDVQQAESYGLEALRLSSETGQVADALGAISDLARIRAARGEPAEAVRLLALVLQHPARDQHAYIRPRSIEKDAEQLRAKLEAKLSTPDYQAAWERGEASDLETERSQALLRHSV